MPVLPTAVDNPDWSGVAFQLSYLGQADPSNTIGVQNGTLYDILDDNNGTGHVAVGASSFNVTCGSIPNITVTGENSTRMVNIFDDSFHFSISNLGKEVILPVKRCINSSLTAPYTLGHIGTLGLVSSEEPCMDLNTA